MKSFIFNYSCITILPNNGERLQLLKKQFVVLYIDIKFSQLTTFIICSDSISDLLSKLLY